MRHFSQCREGADWRTVLKSGDGERAYSFARVSESFAPKASKSDVIKAVNKLGLGSWQLDASGGCYPRPSRG